MKKITAIKEGLKVKVVTKKKRTTISVIDGDKEILLSDVETWETFWNKWIFNDNYIVAYTRGCMSNQIPLNIEAAYNIKAHKLLDLSHKKIKIILEYMLISRRGFDLANVLSEINMVDLGLLKEDKKDDFSRYLTSGNRNISREDIIKYILQIYPQLEKYTGLKDKLSVCEYRSIKDELGESTFWFHAIPQELDFLKDAQDGNHTKTNDFFSFYLAEYEQQQKVISMDRK